MLNKNKKERLFGRRSIMLGSLKAFLMLILTGRLYYLQIIKSDTYKTFSDSNRMRLSLIPPFRGKILDRKGKILATNENYYRVVFDPETTTDTNRLLDRLEQLLELNESDANAMRIRLEHATLRQPVKLYEHLTWKQLSRIEANLAELPGVSIDVAQIRHFTTDKTSSHVIGFLGPATEKEIKRNPLLNHPDFKIGRSGLEKTYEATLRGKVGVKRTEVNAFGLTVNELSRDLGVPGENLRITLDKDIQSYIGQRFGDYTGSAVVMDIHSGEIVGLVSTPGFDPNAFTYGVDPNYWNELLSDPNHPMLNKAISSNYPPGSTFKIIVALAALKDGIDPNETIHCPGYVRLGRRRFHCWKEQGHGHMNMEEAIMHSCNSYFYTIAKSIGFEKIHDMARLFGLGDAHPIGLEDQKSGLVPTPKWKEKRFGSRWQKGDTLNAGIGQGFMLSTPLQLAVMCARIASGKAIDPTLIPRTDYAAKSLGIPSSHLEIVRRGMYHVSNTQGGTAFGSRLRLKNIAMAGKTGTSQIVSKKTLKKHQDNLSEEEKRRLQNHALFIGYAPYDTPKYAVSVVVEHGVGGSKTAAPMARDILTKLYKLKGNA